MKLLDIIKEAKAPKGTSKNPYLPSDITEKMVKTAHTIYKTFRKGVVRLDKEGFFNSNFEGEYRYELPNSFHKLDIDWTTGELEILISRNYSDEIINVNKINIDGTETPIEYNKKLAFTFNREMLLVFLAVVKKFKHFNIKLRETE